MIKFSKIPQFRNVVKEFKLNYTYNGSDELGNPIYKEVRSFPTLVVSGTPKIHGTNASIVLDFENNLWMQSRNNRLHLDGSQGNHFSFNEFVLNNEVFFKKVLGQIKTYLKLPICEVVLFGEWAGEGVQKGVAVSKIDKTFFPFSLKVKLEDDTVENFDLLISRYFYKPEKRIVPVNFIEVYNLEVDFNNPQKSLIDFKELTEKVEQQCPVGKYFGVDGIGEGIVWTFEWNDKKYFFKTKGEKHSVSKVKSVASINPEKLKSIEDFVHYAVTENRVNQAIQETNATSKQQTGDVMRWLANDIVEEESDTLEASNLTWKDVAKQATSKGRQIFFLKLEENM